MLDWPGFEQALLEALLAPIREGGPWLAAGLHELYAETDGVITAPMLFLNTDGKDLDSPAGWEICVEEWAPPGWIEALTAEACSGTVELWDRTFARYQELLARVCAEAGARTGIPVFFIEHSRFEEMLGRCLTAAQLGSLFPEVVAAQAERARVAALPLDDRIAFLVSRLERFDGPLDSEEAQRTLRGLGSAAVPALLALLLRPEQTWLAAKLLAEVGDASPSTLEALRTAMLASTPDSPGRLWSCRALAQLGRVDLVLAEADRLSPQALATAITAPFTSFRDSGSRPLPLDYSILSLYAESLPMVDSELAPGRGYCEIAAAEVPEAMRGATSPHLVIRKHAVCVLGERRLGDEIGARVIPLLREVVESDPDSEVRRLAALSLQGWKADPVPMLWLCGPSGVGKSTVGWEIFSELPRGAFVDADQLGLCYPAPDDDPFNHRLKARNLGALWPLLRAAGAVVMAGGIEAAEQIQLYAGRVPQAALTVCRLRAGHSTLRERFIGRGWMSHLADEAVAEVDELDRLDFGDFSLDTDGLSVAEVAGLVRERAGGWPNLWARSGGSTPATAPDPGERVPVLLLCGATAVGKSTVGYNVFTRLRAEAKAAYADLAQLGFYRPAPAGDPDSHRLKAAALAAVLPGFRDAGARRLVVTGRVNDAATLRIYADSLPGMDLTVCRLHAGPDALMERILRRGRGEGPTIPGDDLKGRTAAELQRIAERAALEAERLEIGRFGDFSVGTDGLSADEVAERIAVSFPKQR